jgi:hypothetical protein
MSHNFHKSSAYYNFCFFNGYNKGTVLYANTHKIENHR